MRILSDSFVRLVERKHYYRRGRYVYCFETEYFPTSFGDQLCRDKIYRYEFQWISSGAILLNNKTKKVIWEGALEHA